MPRMNDYIRDTCKLGQRAACCRYLSASESGLNCEKLTDLGRQIDVLTHMTAKGDNCPGVPTKDWERVLNRPTLEIVS